MTLILLMVPSRKSHPHPPPSVLIPPALYFRKFQNHHSILGLLWVGQGRGRWEVRQATPEEGRPYLSWNAVRPVLSSASMRGTHRAADPGLTRLISSGNRALAASWRAQVSLSALISPEAPLPPWPEPPRISVCFPLLAERGSGPGRPSLQVSPPDGLWSTAWGRRQGSWSLSPPERRV